MYSVTTPVVAEGTPDGDTPAVESQCDILQEDGITKGLYGLCVAFCEAHDASEEFLTEEGFTNLSIPNLKILEHYNKKRDELAGDAEMPCARTISPVDCPAFNQEVTDSMHALIPEQSTVIQMVSYSNDRLNTYENGGNTHHPYTDYAGYVTSWSPFSYVSVFLEYKEFDFGTNGPGIDALIAKYIVRVMVLSLIAILFGLVLPALTQHNKTLMT